VDHNSGGFDHLLDVPMVRGQEAALKALIETMTLFNRCSDAGDRLEAALDLVETYPVETPWGSLNRTELKERMLRADEGAPGQKRLLDRRFETLGGARALCIETWSTGTQDVVTRWTFLVRSENQWKIERLLENETAG
jgi:hypothetical protein